ncbi:histidine phosphatase family protein [uncultured Jatrophihabitans sp.]|uniref:histidine phosphatase family protein n=1 Tax=uncultured Jatrophihabitans sp. TaxID=1610747 RepID=UPI0035CB446B
MTTLHVVRHGQSTWNAAGLLQGQAPGPQLTALGHEQAKAAADSLSSVQVDALYSSDQPRAVQTARHLATRLGLDVRLTAALRERGYGVLEGQPSARAADLAGDVDWLDPDVRPGGAESLRDVHARVGALLARCVDEHPDGAVVLVSHGDTIRVLAACAAGLEAHEIPWTDVGNGSVTTLVVPAPR